MSGNRYPTPGPGDELFIGEGGQYRLTRADGTWVQVGDPHGHNPPWYLSPIGPAVLGVLGLVLAIVALVMAAS